MKPPMSNEDERFIALKSGLSERELLILDSELHRQRKSTLIAYLLWFFLGGLGAHKFYLGRMAAGVVYVIIFLSMWAIPLAVFVLAIWWLVDLVTIPWQVRAYEERLEMDIIASLNAGRGAPHHSMEERDRHWRGAQATAPRRGAPRPAAGRPPRLSAGRGQTNLEGGGRR